MKVFCIHKNFLENREMNVILFLNEFLNILIWPFLSIVKLIAWESKNFQSSVLEFLSHVVQLFVVWWCVFRITCYIDDDYCFLSFEFLKINKVLINISSTQFPKWQYWSLDALFFRLCEVWTHINVIVKKKVLATLIT